MMCYTVSNLFIFAFYYSNIGWGQANIARHVVETHSPNFFLS